MRINLNYLRNRVVFSLLIFCLGGVIAFPTGKIWLAAHWEGSANPELWLKAATLEPENAAYWERLGLYEQADFANGDPKKGNVYLQRATKLNPGVDRLWMELAESYEALGEAALAKRSFERAKQAHPISSDVSWRYGSFLLRQGDLPSGFEEIRRVLTQMPALTESAMEEYWKTAPNIDLILSAGLPANSYCYLGVINFLLSENEIDAALPVWKRLLSLKQPVEMTQAIQLTNALIGKDRISEAQQIWKQTLELSGWPHAKNNNGSIIFNGDFEHEPCNGGFDWRESKLPGILYTLDSTVVHFATKSMRIAFDGGSNFDFAFFQYVPVKSRQAYRFSAYLRTESITTDSGLQFRVYDPFHPGNVQSLTPNMTGTQPWTLVTANILIPNDTDVVVLVLRRTPSWKFDNKLSGTAWIDTVRVVPRQDLAEGSQQ